MSVETWVAEFYPKPSRVTTVEEAAEHSLQKWRGWLPENLERHNVSRGDLAQANLPYRSANMCALCHHYDNENLGTCMTQDEDGQYACPGCPLSETGQQCLNKGSAYNLTEYDHSAEAINRMIAALERAVEWDKDQRRTPEQDPCQACTQIGPACIEAGGAPPCLTNRD